MPLLRLICPGERMPLPSLPGESYTPQPEPSVERLKSSLATRLVQPYRAAALSSEPLEALADGVDDVEGADVVASGAVDGLGTVDRLSEVDGVGTVVGSGAVDGVGTVVGSGAVDGLGTVDGLGAGEEGVGTAEGQSSFQGFVRGEFWGFGWQ
jgi:hypothetical protein